MNKTVVQSPEMRTQNKRMTALMLLILVLVLLSAYATVEVVAYLRHQFPDTIGYVGKWFIGTALFVPLLLLSIFVGVKLERTWLGLPPA